MHASSRELIAALLDLLACLQGTTQLLASLWLLDAYDCQYHQRLSDFCWRFLTPTESPVCSSTDAASAAAAVSPPIAPATPAGPQHNVPAAGAPRSVPPQTPALRQECRCHQVVPVLHT